MPREVPEVDDDEGPGRVQVVSEGDCVAVWLVGEHDRATVGFIRAALIEAVALGEVDVVVDLSAAGFMDASTVGVLVHGQAMVAACGRRLRARSPRRQARNVLEICGLTDLIEAAVKPVDTRRTPRTALETWVVVPVADRAEGTIDEAADAANQPEAATPRPTTVAVDRGCADVGEHRGGL